MSWRSTKYIPVYPLMDFPRISCHAWLNADGIDNGNTSYSLRFLFISWIWFNKLRDSRYWNEQCEILWATSTDQDSQSTSRNFLAPALQSVSPTPWGGERVADGKLCRFDTWNILKVCHFENVSNGGLVRESLQVSSKIPRCFRGSFWNTRFLFQVFVVVSHVF